MSSTLDFGESATLDTATLNKITDSGCSVYKATDLTLTASSGAALDLPATSRIETGTLTLDNSGTGVTLASGEIRLAGANGASTAALTGATLTLNSNSGNSADAVLRLRLRRTRGRAAVGAAGPAPSARGVPAAGGARRSCARLWGGGRASGSAAR